MAIQLGVHDALGDLKPNQRQSASYLSQRGWLAALLKATTKARRHEEGKRVARGFRRR